MGVVAANPMERPADVAHEPEDVASFCRRILPRLVRALTVYLGEREVADELAQDALLRAWERWGVVSRAESPDAWVFRVAFNLANSTIRRRFAGRRARARLTTASPSSREIEGLLDLRAAIDELPPRQRAAVILRHLIDMPIEEAAVALGCAPGTVKSLTAKGVARLRERLGEALDAPEES